MVSANRSEGHVYVLVSPICKYIKIGGTDHPPLKRIREINSCEPYKGIGPWVLHDFRQVSDWRKVERRLHYIFRSKLVRSLAGQRELFATTPIEASAKLNDEVPPDLLLRKPKIDRMFQDEELANFLGKLFRSTTILNWVNLQGAWTFSLFPRTMGGRYYTINIGPHEVAFATTASRGDYPIHMIHMDSLVRDFKEVSRWVKARSGGFESDNYDAGLDHSTSIFFQGAFNAALEFLSLPGVRRAIIAYWTEALIGLQEAGTVSTYAKHHNWNAVAELKSRIEAGKL